MGLFVSMTCGSIIINKRFHKKNFLLLKMKKNFGEICKIILFEFSIMQINRDKVNLEQER